MLAGSLGAWPRHPNLPQGSSRVLQVIAVSVLCLGTQATEGPQEGIPNLHPAWPRNLVLG